MRKTKAPRARAPATAWSRLHLRGTAFAICRASVKTACEKLFTLKNERVLHFADCLEQSPRRSLQEQAMTSAASLRPPLLLLRAARVARAPVLLSQPLFRRTWPRSSPTTWSQPMLQTSLEESIVSESDDGFWARPRVFRLTTLGPW